MSSKPNWKKNFVQTLYLQNIFNNLIIRLKVLQKNLSRFYSFQIQHYNRQIIHFIRFYKSYNVFHHFKVEIQSLKNKTNIKDSKINRKPGELRKQNKKFIQKQCSFDQMGILQMRWNINLEKEIIVPSFEQKFEDSTIKKLCKTDLFISKNINLASEKDAN
ncbi:unnamed protein product [Paramecium sonneborni]|uniref:Uncharacterized protein n=1 Tax=Paramecium sonneborni TaxID=65129 RepID=A0A8S1RNH6_9CILI|nr:unnamed protein product [Paramecium sonneborni]